ncbi:signal peptide containing protein [Theileria equi strain WA]|uniref:Signal peptide containing protein n=1 Tax=Theileria equi strain WA TaxID=1537102 RepID=L1LAL9_THEEQ|nr:signal peptide containing protein [Theileria equi strain WA]EKX72320.1 signal peptide containing protein [Theileria equi strain WA]|eukprot:XP_004831772.1 signal peptide containing protein [Theileria equi strain WA]
MKIPVLFSFILISLYTNAVKSIGSSSKNKNDESKANTEVKNEVVEAAASTVSGDIAIDTSAIDISRPETSNIYGLDFGADDVKSKTFYPGNSIYTTRVLDNGVLIWEGKGEEKCQTVEFYSKGDSKLLKLLIIVGSSSNVGNVYFEKVNGKWKNIEKGVDFDKKLEGLNK